MSSYVAHLVAGGPNSHQPMYLCGWSRPRLNGVRHQLAVFATDNADHRPLTWATEAGARRAAENASKGDLTFVVETYCG
jgi:hypothetical protein